MVLGQVIGDRLLPCANTFSISLSAVRHQSSIPSLKTCLHITLSTLREVDATSRDRSIGAS